MLRWRRKTVLWRALRVETSIKSELIGATTRNVHYQRETRSDRDRDTTRSRYVGKRSGQIVRGDVSVVYTACTNVTHWNQIQAHCTARQKNEKRKTWTRFRYVSILRYRSDGPVTITTATIKVKIIIVIAVISRSYIIRVRVIQHVCYSNRDDCFRLNQCAANAVPVFAASGQGRP